MARTKRTRKTVPTFRTEAQERRFWETHDTTDYVDWSAAQSIRLPNLKPSTETISLRLPAGLLADLKALANKQDVPYQSLLKMFLADRVAREWRASRSSHEWSNLAPQPSNRARRQPKPTRRRGAARG
jgi:predicted DNA binding CopG/RHH family protein